MLIELYIKKRDPVTLSKYWTISLPGKTNGHNMVCILCIVDTNMQEVDFILQ